MISFENVSKFILSDINVHIPKGVAVGLIGASGAGKTTFMKMVCGLLAPSDGYVFTFGKNPVSDRRQLAHKLSAYFTDIPLLDGEDTVLGNFQTLEISYRQNKKKFWEEYQSLSYQFGFSRYETSKLRQLSLGQRKRVELSAALICHPKLLLLDEPANGLDEQGKAILWELLRQRMSQGLTLLLASHTMTEVCNLCYRILLLDNGKLLYYGNQEQLMRKYASVHCMQLRIQGSLPDMEDLPLIRYSILPNMITLSYDSNYITSAEIMGQLLKQTTILEIKMIRPGIEDIITKRKEELEI